MWDLAAVVERIQLLAAERNYGAIRQLCEGPEVRTIAKVAQLINWGLNEGVDQLLTAVVPRETADKPLAETEIAPRLVDNLAGKDVLTIGDFSRHSDDQIVALCPTTSPEELRTARTVVKWHVEQAQKVAAWRVREAKYAQTGLRR